MKLLKIFFPILIVLIQCTTFDNQVNVNPRVKSNLNQKYVILPFDNKDEVLRNDINEKIRISNLVKDKFEMTFIKTGWITLERSKIDKILQEMSLSQTGLTEADGIKVGKLLNANSIIIGVINEDHYESRKAKYFINYLLKAIDVETGMILWSMDLNGQYSGRETPDKYNKLLKNILNDSIDKLIQNSK